MKFFYNLNLLLSLLLVIVNFLRAESPYTYLAILGALIFIKYYSYFPRLCKLLGYFVTIILSINLILFFLRFFGFDSLPLIGNLPLLGWDNVDEFGVPITNSRGLFFTDINVQRVPGLFGNIHLTSLVLLVSFLFWRRKAFSFLISNKNQFGKNIYKLNFFRILSLITLFAILLSLNYQYILLLIIFLYLERKKNSLLILQKFISLKINFILKTTLKLSFIFKFIVFASLVIAADFITKTTYITTIIPILISTTSDGFDLVLNSLNNLSDSNAVSIILFGSREFESNIHDADIFIPIIEEVQFFTYLLRYGLVGVFTMISFLILLSFKADKNDIKIFIYILPLTFIHYCNIASPYVLFLLTFLVCDSNKLSKVNYNR